MNQIMHRRKLQQDLEQRLFQLHQHKTQLVTMITDKYEIGQRYLSTNASQQYHSLHRLINDYLKMVDECYEVHRRQCIRQYEASQRERE